MILYFMGDVLATESAVAKGSLGRSSRFALFMFELLTVTEINAGEEMGLMSCQFGPPLAETCSGLISTAYLYGIMFQDPNFIYCNVSYFKSILTHLSI